MTVQRLEAGRCIPLQGQIVEHTAGAEDPAVAGREYRRDDDDIDNIRCAGDAEFFKGHHKWGSHVSDLIPWIDGHDDAQREHIENKDTPEDFVDGFLDGGLRIMRFTRSDADDLDAKIGIHDHDKCHQGAGKTIREEAAVLPKVCDAGRNAAIANAEDDHADAADDHENDGADLHEGKPEFKLAIGRDGDEIHHGHDDKCNER